MWLCPLSSVVLTNIMGRTGLVLRGQTGHSSSIVFRGQTVTMYPVLSSGVRLWPLVGLYVLIVAADTSDEDGKGASPTVKKRAPWDESSWRSSGVEGLMMAASGKGRRGQQADGGAKRQGGTLIGTADRRECKETRR